MIRAPLTFPSHRERSGTTLVEVLMSILLMGIGLVALATLFPASILRTVRAHHLTAGTNLRFNAEAVLDLYPTYIADWDAIDPILLVPKYPSAIPSPGVTGYIVMDPQGHIEAGAPVLPTEDYFGDNALIRRQEFNTSAPLFDLDGDASGVGDRDDAVLFTTSPDDWEPVLDGPVENFGAPYEYVDIETDPTLLAGVADLIGDQSDPIRARVILYSTTGKGAEYRYITEVETGSPNRIHWAEDNAVSTDDRNDDGDTADNYPIDSTFEPERVKVEVSDPRLSWLMSVRRTYVDGTKVSNNADIVVFFNRNFEEDSERVYTGSSMVLGSTQVVLNASDINPEPRVGNYIFDAEKCHWYKVVSVESKNPYVLSIDRPAVKGSQSLMLVRNVVDVYPLKTFTTE